MFLSNLLSNEVESKANVLVEAVNESDRYCFGGDKGRKKREDEDF